MALLCLWKDVLVVGLGILLSIISALPTPQASGETCSRWTNLGCFDDSSTTVPTLRFSVVASATGLTTIENCQAACLSHGYKYSGAEFGYECFCDNSIQNAATPENSFACNQPCFGSFTETCGGLHAVSVYEEDCTSASSSLAEPLPSTSSLSVSPTSPTGSFLPVLDPSSPDNDSTSTLSTEPISIPTASSVATSRASPTSTVYVTSRVTLTSPISSSSPTSSPFSLSSDTQSYINSPGTFSRSTHIQSSQTHSHSPTGSSISSLPEPLIPPPLDAGQLHSTGSIPFTSTICITTAYAVTSCPIGHPCTSLITTETITSYATSYSGTTIFQETTLSYSMPPAQSSPLEAASTKPVSLTQSSPSAAETLSRPYPEYHEQIEEGSSMSTSLPIQPSPKTAATSTFVSLATAPSTVQTSIVTIAPISSASLKTSGTIISSPSPSSPPPTQVSTASDFSYQPCFRLILGIVIALVGASVML